LELCFWIAKDSIETRWLQFSNPQQIEFCLGNLTGKLFDDLSTAAALKRFCQGLDVLAEGWTYPIAIAKPWRSALRRL